MSKKTTVLMILDGYGIEKKAEGNAIAQAKKPVMDKPLTVYVGGAVFSYLSKRATKFYLSRNNREIPRLFLENDNTVYLISTFDIKNKIGR